MRSIAGCFALASSKSLKRPSAYGRITSRSYDVMTSHTSLLGDATCKWSCQNSTIISNSCRLLSTDRAILAMPSSVIAVHDPLLYEERICITDLANDGYAAATYAVHTLSSIAYGFNCSSSQVFAPRARRSATS